MVSTCRGRGFVVRVRRWAGGSRRPPPRATEAGSFLTSRVEASPPARDGGRVLPHVPFKDAGPSSASLHARSLYRTGEPRRRVWDMLATSNAAQIAAVIVALV